MIIPKRDAKCYGAVHIDNYLTFTGFCKKVDSNEICGVDVFVDGKKIDTLKADKRIAKVEEIYDIEGHGFAFELEEKYFEKTHSLEFKASSGEELVNSKIQTIDKNHVKFNEYRFLHSLGNVDVEKIKDLYCPNSVGFLATEKNLNDNDFVEYIKELMVRFPNVEFKAFYFNQLEKELIKSRLNKIDNIFILNNYFSLNTSVLLVGKFANVGTDIIKKIVVRLPNLFVSYFYDDISSMEVSDQRLQRDDKIHKEALLYAGIPENFHVNHFELSLLNYINNNLLDNDSWDENISLFEMRHFRYIKLALENKSFVKVMSKLRKFLYENN